MKISTQLFHLIAISMVLIGCSRQETSTIGLPLDLWVNSDRSLTLVYPTNAINYNKSLEYASTHCAQYNMIPEKDYQVSNRNSSYYRGGNTTAISFRCGVGKLVQKSPIIASRKSEDAIPSGLHYGENFFLPLLKGWRYGPGNKRLLIQSSNTTMKTIYMYPEGQSAENWSQLISSRIINEPGKSQIYLKAILDKHKSNCKNPLKNNQVKITENGYNSYTLEYGCPKHNLTGEGNFSLVKTIEGADSFYIIRRLWRGGAYAKDNYPISPIEHTKWLDLFKKISVCDTRGTDHPCSGFQKINSEKAKSRAKYPRLEKYLATLSRRDPVLRKKFSEAARHLYDESCHCLAYMLNDKLNREAREAVPVGDFMQRVIVVGFEEGSYTPIIK